VSPQACSDSNSNTWSLDVGRELIGNSALESVLCS